ncbi:phosphoadenosine phosphosulfate reductase family protein [Ahrensia kielensis]|uniref:phosphoadenosine phosphosulfate reductase domain-containing protein n=1 Tax=Ahrensia kielensis TaxID=76980 RepID=UPI00036A9232|nr:phosphoadenosine phosphosulfate reductase family protein [Ahrensia kielensis]
MNYVRLAKALNDEFAALPLDERVALIAKKFPKAIFPTNFSTEDQLIAWAIINHGNRLKIVTTLNGLLLENAQTLRSITAEQYDIDIPAVKAVASDVWISGLRNEQLSANKSIEFAKWDDDRGVLQINPLADWTFDKLIKSIAEHEIPINPLFEFKAGSKIASPARKNTESSKQSIAA